MELGQRLKQARLEAGLSQRQLCGETITRNMLSQIENGSARPSMDTLGYLAGQLGKPISYFLEEQVVSPNQSILEQVRSAQPEKALELLRDYQAPDPVFDWERYLIEALACFALAQTAMGEGRHAYARSLLEQAAAAGSQTPYYTRELERRRLLLCYRAGSPAAELCPLLPDNTEELLLRAAAALEAGDPVRCGQLLESAQTRDESWRLLRAEAFFARKDFARAAEQYALAGNTPAIYARLEACYRELEDYKMAYHYACKQR